MTRKRAIIPLSEHRLFNKDGSQCVLSAHACVYKLWSCFGCLISPCIVLPCIWIRSTREYNIQHIKNNILKWWMIKVEPQNVKTNKMTQWRIQRGSGVSLDPSPPPRETNFFHFHGILKKRYLWNPYTVYTYEHMHFPEILDPPLWYARLCNPQVPRL